MPLLDGNEHDAAAARLDGVAADDLVGRPVGALDEDVRLDGRMISAGVSSSKIDDGIDARERREDLGALVLGRDRPRRALVARAPTRSELRPTISSVAVGARGLEVADVAGVQQVEHAVREDDRLPACAQRATSATPARGQTRADGRRLS